MFLLPNKTKVGEVVLYIIYGFMALFPFMYFNSFLYWGTSLRSVVLIGVSSLIFIISLFYYLRKNNQLVVPKSPILLVGLIYLVSIIISGIAGVSFENTFWSMATRTTGIWYLICLAIMVWFLVGFMEDQSVQNKIIKIVVFSTALYSFLAFLSPEGVNLLFFDFKSDGFTFGNSTFAAMYIFGAFLLSIYYLYQVQLRKWWMYFLPFVILMSPEIIRKELWFGDFSEGFLGDARTTTYVILLSVLALLCIWAVSKIKDLKLRSTVAYGAFGLGIVAVIIFAISLFSNNGFVRNFYLSQSTAIRPLLWELSEGLIAERPILGWGADNFERLFEKKYDNRFLQTEFGNEAWLDRAHNVFMDQLVDGGILGLFFYLTIYVVVILCLIYAALKSSNKNDRALASILIVYFSFHLLELQTAFDTSISYTIVALMISLAAVVFHRTYQYTSGKQNSIIFKPSIKYVLISVSGIFVFWSFFWGWIPFVRAQLANGSIRKVGNSEARIPFYKIMFNSPVDEHSFLWRTVTDFQRGIGQNPNVLDNSEKIKGLKKESEIFAQEYRNYVKSHPDHFRAHLNLADILIYQRLFGVDNLKEAQNVLDEAINLVPESPQPYWMKAVAYVYMRKFDLAREYAQRGLELNPKIVQSKNVVNYVEKSIKTFPSIDLFFFRQI